MAGTITFGSKDLQAARLLGGQAYVDMLGCPCPPSLDLRMKDWETETNGYPSDVTFTRATIATKVNAKGVIEQVGSGVLRHDYAPVTGEYLGILVEEARTNRLLNSLVDGTNLSTQDVTVTATAHTLSFYGTGSVALSGVHTATLAGTGAYPTRVTLTFTPTAGTLTCTVTGDVKFANLTVGSFATSHIPTAGATVTRNADEVSMTGADFTKWFNAVEGTVLSAFTCYASGVNQRGWIINDGTNTNYIGLAITNSGGGSMLYVQVIVAHVSQATVPTGTTLVANRLYQFATAYKLNDFAGSRDGGVTEVDTSGTLPTVNLLNLGAWAGGTGGFLNGHLRQFTYFPKKLSSALLQTISKP